MLKVLNLFVVDKIFNEASDKLGGMSRALYINCLTSHFRDKKAIAVHARAFEMFEQDFEDFGKYRKYFQELHKAGLITINDNSIQKQNNVQKIVLK